MMHHADFVRRDPYMKTGNIENANAQYIQQQNTIKEEKAKQKQNNNELLEQLLNPIDKYTPSVEGAADPAKIDRLWKETNHAAEAIQKLIQSALGRYDASGQGFWALRAKGHFKLSEAERAEAQAMISEDGFFGVKQTTARIMDFAKALVGENASPEQIENMRAAVQKGFDEVAKMFGGFDKLPDVTKQTYDAIMEAFDGWLGGGATAAAEE